MIAIAIHGGCGERVPEDGPPVREYRASLEQVVNAGHAVLERGGGAVDAVVAVVSMMEDCGLYNAGRGSVANRDGSHELDASLMDGATLAAGAVACVRSVRNPIVLARRVMDESGHVLLAGVGAEEYAAEQGLALVDESWYDAAALQSLRAGEFDVRDSARRDDRQRAVEDDHGTVGAVALDRAGNLAAGTSTGGTTGKHAGRIGDSPLIGAGTWAANGCCAVSATGAGEYFVRVAAAHDVAALVQYGRLPLPEAVAAVLSKVEVLRGTGGLIALDAYGRVAMGCSTRRMYRASIDARGARLIAIRADEGDTGNPRGGSAVSR
jgi:beta-aspartyl-peptidase (threonine type)